MVQKCCQTSDISTKSAIFSGASSATDEWRDDQRGETLTYLSRRKGGRREHVKDASLIIILQGKLFQ